MSNEIATKVYFLFERRQSPRHKWIAARGCNGKIPQTIDDASSVYFVPSRWKIVPHDAQGTQFLCSILPFQVTKRESKCDESIFETFVSTINDFRKANVNSSVIVGTEKLIDTNRKHLSLHMQQIVQKSPNNIIYQSAITAQQLVQFIDELGDETQTKRQHTIIRLIFQHIQLKLCTLQYPHVRVHLIITVATPPSPLTELKLSSSQVTSSPQVESAQFTSPQVDSSKVDSSSQVNSPQVANSPTPQKDEVDFKTLIDCSRLLHIDQKLDEAVEAALHQAVVDEQEKEKEKKKEEKEKATTARNNEPELEKTTRQLCVADVYNFDGDGWDIENVDDISDDIPPLISLDDIVQVKNAQDDDTFSSDSEDVEKLIPRAPVTNAVLKEESAKKPLNLPEIPINRIEQAAAQNITKLNEIPINRIIQVGAQTTTKLNECETFPQLFSLLGKSNILAISDLKEETRCITRWIHRKQQLLNPLITCAIGYISQNFSESECIGIERYVEEQRDNGGLIVIGVECEFSPVERVSRECTTLLNEFDGRTSLLILKLIAYENTTIVFETTKPFNHVWCSKYNIVNTPSSQWFAKASRLGDNDLQDAQKQKSAQAAAVVQLVCHQSEQAAALVRCANQQLSNIGKVSFFDSVALGCHADCSEKQRVFNSINDHCLQHKLEHSRWHTRVVRLEKGDAFYIPMSERQNDQLHEHTTMDSNNKNYAIAGASGAFASSPTDYRRIQTHRSTVNSIFGMFGNTTSNIPTPSSYMFTNPSADFQFGDPYVLKNVAAFAVK